MKYWIKLAALLAASISLASPLAAQSFNPALDAQQRDMRVSAAITIPLGHSTDRRQTAPRFEIITRTRAPNGFSPIIARAEDQRWQERRIGIALDGSDALMINGRPLQSQGNQANLNTGETFLVVGGVVLLGVVVGVALWADALNDARDGPDYD